jgi:tetratricopeptide (TPR) repeat protein
MTTMNDIKHPVYLMIDRIWNHILQSLYAGTLDYEPSVKTLKQSLEVAREMKHVLLQGRLFSALGMIELELDHYPESEQYYLEALRLYEAIDRRTNRFETAADYYARSQEVASSQNDYTGQVAALNNQGWVWLALRDVDRAMPLFYQAIELARDHGEENIVRIAIGETNQGLAQAYFIKKQFPEARQFAARSMEIAKRYNQSAQVAATYQIMAQIAASDPVPDESPAEFFQHSREYWQRAQALTRLARTLLVEGDYWATQKSNSKALDCYQEAAQLFETHQMQAELSEAQERIEKLNPITDEQS